MTPGKAVCLTTTSPHAPPMVTAPSFTAEPLDSEPQPPHTARAGRASRRGLWLSLGAHLLGVLLFYWLALHPGPVLAPAASVQGERLIRATLVTQEKESPMVAESHQASTTAPKPAPAKQEAAKQHTATSLAMTPAIPAPTPVSSAHPKQAHKVRAQAPKPKPKPKPASATKVQKSSATATATSAPTPATLNQPNVVSPAMPATAASVPAKHETSASQTSQATNQPSVSAQTTEQDAEPKIVPARYLGPPSPVTYPLLARRRGLQGEALIEVWLDKEGEQLRRIIIKSSGHTLLDLAALRSIAQSRFAPYEENGQPHPSRLRIPVAFKLSDP